MSLTKPLATGRAASGGAPGGTRTADPGRPQCPSSPPSFSRRVCGRGSISRARIVGLLAEKPGVPVTAIIAPPGYGKTTLLAQWAAHEQCPVAWLSIDDQDNDPAVFVAYLKEAFRGVTPGRAQARTGLRGRYPARPVTRHPEAGVGAASMVAAGRAGGRRHPPPDGSLLSGRAHCSHRPPPGWIPGRRRRPNRASTATSRVGVPQAPCARSGPTFWPSTWARRRR